MSKSLLFGVYDKVAQKYIGLEVSDRDSTIISAFGCYFLCTWAIRYQHELRIYAFFAFPQLTV